jgi:ethanolamine ammonia-lyase large subunit
LYQALRSSLDAATAQEISSWTLIELKRFVLSQPEPEIQRIMPGLSSDVIGCLVKLMSNQELIAVGAKVFNPLPGSQIGARGYLGARIQPNSPTDHPDDIRWQVFNGFAYAVGDVVLGTNPVSSEPQSVLVVQQTLQDILHTFDLQDILPHCVLAHIHVQAQVEREHPGSTAVWFQSIAGSDSANATFDITLEQLVEYAKTKGGPFGLYFETGQGADFTNGHDHGYDMVLHESRKYGLARLLSHQYARANAWPGQPWVHVNDVAGFIGPEVFRTKQQLVRCCLEDIVMGKLHGLCLGLDVCATLHMDISMQDLDWCLEQLVPACPAYLMALPTKVDPMLGYLTTGFQDHVRLRERHNCRVNDRMWQFFQQLGVIDQDGKPTRHFGDPLWVYLQYRRRAQDNRTDQQIIQEGQQLMQQVGKRGVFLSSGYDQKPYELQPELASQIQHIYDDAKASLWAELSDEFLAGIPQAVFVSSRSTSRENYILRPASGEQLNDVSLQELTRLRQQYDSRYDVQIVVSDGLNALALMEPDQLNAFLEPLRQQLQDQGHRVAPETIVVRYGRVRAGYQIGQMLFGGLPGRRAIIHVIGERPGTGHRTFSAYFTCPEGKVWSNSGQVDHDQTRVVAGIAKSALSPPRAAEDVVRILDKMWNQK